MLSVFSALVNISEKITTKEPSKDQLEVAIAALKAALGMTEIEPVSDKTAVS